MATVECPHNDKGLCAIPVRTAVVQGGVVKQMSRDDIELMTGTTASLELVRELSEHEAAALQAAADDEDDEAVLNVLREVPPHSVNLVVNCSCGHVWLVKATR